MLHPDVIRVHNYIKMDKLIENISTFYNQKKIKKNIYLAIGLCESLNS